MGPVWGGEMFGWITEKCKNAGEINLISPLPPPQLL